MFIISHVRACWDHGNLVGHSEKNAETHTINKCDKRCNGSIGFLRIAANVCSIHLSWLGPSFLGQTTMRCHPRRDPHGRVSRHTPPTQTQATAHVAGGSGWRLPWLPTRCLSGCAQSAAHAVSRGACPVQCSVGGAKPPAGLDHSHQVQVMLVDAWLFSGHLCVVGHCWHCMQWG